MSPLNTVTRLLHHINECRFVGAIISPASQKRAIPLLHTTQWVHCIPRAFLNNDHNPLMHRGVTDRWGAAMKRLEVTACLDYQEDDRKAFGKYLSKWPYPIYFHLYYIFHKWFICLVFELLKMSTAAEKYRESFWTSLVTLQFLVSQCNCKKGERTQSSINSLIDYCTVLYWWWDNLKFLRPEGFVGLSQPNHVSTSIE